MRVASILCLIGVAAAGPVPSILQARQGSVIVSGLDNIGKAIDDTMTAVGGWNGKGDSFSTITAKIDTVTSAIKDATTKIKAASSLSIIDATGVVPPATTLDGKLGSLMNAVVGKKSVIASAGKTSQVKTILTDEKTNAQALVAAILAKMPTLAGPIAQPITQGFITKLDGAINAF